MAKPFDMALAIIIHPLDNVATALTLIPSDSPVALRKGDSVYRIVTREEIPRGHKVALVAVRKGDEIVKYGDPIGRATIDVQPGCHVHIHNLESQRGRGDLKKKRNP
jgi:altronate dehydratase small subunit